MSRNPSFVCAAVFKCENKDCGAPMFTWTELDTPEDWEEHIFELGRERCTSCFTPARNRSGREAVRRLELAWPVPE